MDLQIELIEEFMLRNIPITIAVIPFWQEKEIPVNNKIVQRFGGKIESGMIEVAQHGFSHRQSNKEQTEFLSVTYQSQVKWIQRGKEILERAFSSNVTTFVPPWNNYDGNTIRTVVELKFNCLSGDLGPVDGQNRSLIDTSTNSMAYIPASSSFREVGYAVELALSPQVQSKRFRNFIVVCFHPYDFISSAKRPIEKNELTRILDELKYMPVEFATLSEASTKFGEQLHLSRQIKAARVENLGKVLKLIPGFGFLLPSNYDFGRWIPFGIYFPEEVYSIIEASIIIKISFVLFLIWILFVEGSRLVLRKKKHTCNIAIWVLINSIFSFSFVLYFSVLPEHSALALACIWASGICLLYWIIRVLLFPYIALRKAGNP